MCTVGEGGGEIAIMWNMFDGVATYLFCCILFPEDTGDFVPHFLSDINDFFCFLLLFVSAATQILCIQN